MASRKPDNQTPPLWIEEGETRLAPLVTVAPVAPIDKLYTFTADPETAAAVRVGQRVLVPFGRKSTLRPAIVVGVETGPWSSTLKPVAEILDPAGQLSPHLLELGHWIARYYVCPLGRTLGAMVPQPVRRQSGFRTVRQVRLVAGDEQLAAVRLGAKQKAVIDLLRQSDGACAAEDLYRATGASRATLKGMIAKGWLAETVTKEAPPSASLDVPRAEPAFTLNGAQERALAQIGAALTANTFRALVLFGVSGSGKTEVYVRAMRRVLAAGRQAIMLVPEIALTTQLVQRLAARFERVAVIHSGLSDVERSLAWEAIRTARTPVVIGTRSAVFAPCPNLGLIVVDEEQETSFKNLQSPRFHVRDVAIKRAHLLGIPVVLGSATPSLETWHNVRTLPTYERLDLPERVRTLPLPQVRLVDMRHEKSPLGGAVLSPILHEALADTLRRGEQAVLLLNRRGYATWLYCPVCKRRVQCPNCQVGMVLHRARPRMLCHHCHESMPIPTHCADPSCRARLVRGGGGTERIEEQLREAFPTARLHRADSDTMTHARKYAALVSAFEAGEIDILLGTQMIAKGLDFPKVALVGVIGADLVALGDFRAAERLFQLVAQVAGRAGRADVPGRVVVQTASADQPALRFAMHHDFEGFAVGELAARQRMQLPPYSRLARFVLAGSRERAVMREADALAERLREAITQPHAPRAVLLGPHPCALERARGMYRYELLLRAPTAGTLRAVLDRARHEGALKTRAKSFIVDVDPVTLV